MRIVHVTDCYLPRVGGIELHVRDLADQQRAAGHDVTVVTATSGAELPGVVRVGRGSGDWLAGLHPDVVHAHVSIVSPFALSGARRAGSAGLPTLVTVHSLWSHVGPVPQLARDLWGMGRWPVTWSAVSEQAARPVRSVLGVPVHVLPNAIDLAAWRPRPARELTGPPRVVSVMRLTGVKGALPLLRILHEASTEVDLRATIIGDGPKRAAMEAYLSRNDLTDRVRLAGTLGADAIRDHLDTAAAFVAPAHRESFGIAALEARTSGLPVVASAVSGVASFIEHGTDGLLARDDHEMARQVALLLGDPALRAGIAVHNRAVPPRLGWADSLDRHAELYAVAGCVGVRRVAAA